MSGKTILTVGKLVGGPIQVLNPDPRFIYNANRYITGLTQGSPNILDT